MTKKNILLGLLAVSINYSFSQNKVTIIKEQDEMDDRVFYYTSSDIVVADETKKKGFRIEPYINKDVKFTDLNVKMVGLGNCNENNELIFLFENGNKIKLTSWNDFNCEGYSFFSIGKSEMEMLKKHKISKIRLTNGKGLKAIQER